MTPSDEVLLKLGRDRILAHQVLFRHRHSHATPAFHCDMIRDWHSPIRLLCTMAFRGAAKSTTAEEALAIASLYGLFHNGIIVGSTEKRACERLAAIKYELANNELIADLVGPFDEHTSHTWNEAEAIFSNNVRLAALGRGQSLRGTKYLQWRPDFAFLDDIEDVDEGKLYTKEDAEETRSWFLKVLLPALDRDARVRVNATPLGPDCLPLFLMTDPDWVTKVYPIEYIDAAGERRAIWEDRYPLSWVDQTMASFDRAGLHHEYMREYMCQAEDPKRKLFTSSMIIVKPRLRTWEPTFAMFDPARTTKATSATTGWAVWSWVSNRLIVWDGGGEMWKPDEQINKIFAVADEYQPVFLGVEQDGLEEFLLQPIRQEQLKRGTVIPIKPVRAPKGKFQFIESLQPFFVAGEVTFAKDLPEMKKQFESYPSGRIDGPNALAYAKHHDLYPGLVVYEDFTSTNVVENLPVRERQPVWLCLNAGGGVVTAAACQFIQGAIHVVCDYVVEGDAGSVLASLVAQAALDSGEVRLLAGQPHFADFNPVGLRGAVAKLPADLRAGSPCEVGRDEIRALLQKQTRGRPAFLISTRARWTLNAFAAGYARMVDKRGVVAEEARPGIYRALVEGIEAFAGLLRGGVVEAPLNTRMTEGGQRYVSTLPDRTVPPPAKGDAWRADDRITGVEHLRR